MTAVLYVFATLAGLLGLALAYLAVLALWEYTWRIRDRVDRLRCDHQIRTLDLKRQEADVIRVYPNEAGQYPALLGYGGIILDITRGATFDLTGGTRTLTGELARPAQLAQVLRAAGGWPKSEEAAALLNEPEAAPAWPERVDLLGLFQNRTPTLHDLVVGVSLSDGGDLQVVSASLHDLMHVLSVGASGWGKSTWLRALVWQLAKAREPVEVIAIDPYGAALNALRGWGKLRYPVARSIETAAAVLREVSQEIARRKGLYERYPLATKLPEYNAVAGEPLPPWVVIFDEGTASLNAGGVGDPLRNAIQTARQYGVYVLLAGQSAKHNVIDVQVRDQFSTRLCFRVSPSSSRVVLDDSGASHLTVKGRALAQLVGRPMVELQGPFIDQARFVEALTDGGARFPMPDPAVVIRGDGGVDPELVARILALHEADASDTRIAREVFGYGNAFYIEKVRQVLRQQQQWDDGNGPLGAV